MTHPLREFSVGSLVLHALGYRTVADGTRGKQEGTTGRAHCPENVAQLVEYLIQEALGSVSCTI